VVVEDVESYCVVKERYIANAEILRESVVNWQRRGYNFFLLPDERAVTAALEAGATRAVDVDLALGL
jgi:hypothetical protein